jgi:dolichyl-phosphate-mannose-protein mannosyltransferase
MASKSRDRQLLLLLAAGSSFGASVACKWNGLWFLLGIYILLAIAQIWKIIKSDRKFALLTNSLLNQFAYIHPIAIFITLVIVPIATYSLLWIPHLIQNPEPNFIGVQWAILNYHEQIGNGNSVHPYCANWYTWPLMMRPLAYYFTEYKPNYYYDVHAMGNPLLWWLALAAVFGSLWLIIRRLWLVRNTFRIEKAILSPVGELNLNYISVPLFIIVNYAANLLPWVRVTRCLYIYHYMGAVLFAILGLAWVIDLGLRSRSKLWQIAGLTTIFGVAAAFIFWLPIFLGLSIEKTQLSLRLWDFWIFRWI